MQFIVTCFITSVDLFSLASTWTTITSERIKIFTFKICKSFEKFCLKYKFYNTTKYKITVIIIGRFKGKINRGFFGTFSAMQWIIKHKVRRSIINDANSKINIITLHQYQQRPRNTYLNYAKRRIIKTIMAAQLFFFNVHVAWITCCLMSNILRQGKNIMRSETWNHLKTRLIN